MYGSHKATVIATAASVMLSCATMQSLSPPYASQQPIRTPAPYAAGTLTTVNGIAFTDDGRTLYVSHRVEGLDYRGRRRSRIFQYQYDNGRWSQPSAVGFSREFTDYQPVLSPDGSRMYFTSTRPRLGTSEETRQNIWVTEKRSGTWGEPRILGELATPGWDGYAVETSSGRLYFVSEREGGRGAVDIWTADPQPDGRYGKPVNVQAVNSEISESDLYVDPAERFMIFHRADRDEIDFWIAFRSDGAWLAPRPLDEVNGEGWELSPTVTPDGEYFFFNRDGTLHQIDFCALIRPGERVFVPECRGA